jgi:hypothetical protein
MKPFHRELLPPASSFYMRELKKLSRPSRGWAQALCPFHDDHDPSFSVKLDTGGFFCFACQAKGGDLVDFLMLRDGLNFKAAAQQLGAWRDGRPLGERPEPAQQKRQRKDDAGAELAKGVRRLRLEYRASIHAMEQIVRDMGKRLLGRLTVEDYGLCGHVLSMALDELREAVAAYYLLTFGTDRARADFFLHPEQRDDEILAVLLCGSVRDEERHLMEVCFDA